MNYEYCKTYLHGSEEESCTVAGKRHQVGAVRHLMIEPTSSKAILTSLHGRQYCHCCCCCRTGLIKHAVSDSVVFLPKVVI